MVPPVIRLAVLPFLNLTGDPAQEYLSDGLTDDLITHLGQLHPQRLRVIARSSSMRYKSAQPPLEEVARALGVEYVLEGSTRREGNLVVISTALIRLSDQTPCWSRRFERALADILALQNEVARGVADSLALALLPAEEQRLARAPVVNLDAYEACLRGLSHWEKLTREDLDTAQRYFELALERDPSYALAHTGIARVWIGRSQMGFATAADLRAANPDASLARAIDLDPALPEAHFCQAALATWRDWDWAGAEPQFLRALELNPNYAEAHAYYSHYLMLTGRQESGMVEMKRALSLDPLNPLYRALYGVNLLILRRFGDALDAFRDSLTTAPLSPLALAGVADALHGLGRCDEALTAERGFWRAVGDGETDAALARGASEGGYREAMRRAGDVLAARGRALGIVPPRLRVTRFYVRAGEFEPAIDWLERSCEAGDQDMPYFFRVCDVDPVREHPRVRAVAARLNLSF